MTIFQTYNMASCGLPRKRLSVRASIRLCSSPRLARLGNTLNKLPRESRLRLL